MNNKEIKDLEKKREQIGRRMPRGFKIIKGSLVDLRRVCGKTNCHCQKGKKHISLYLSRSHKGKTKMTYISKRNEKEVREYVKRHKQLIGVVEELSSLNIEIIKNKG